MMTRVTETVVSRPDPERGCSLSNCHNSGAVIIHHPGLLTTSRGVSYCPYHARPHLPDGFNWNQLNPNLGVDVTGWDA